MVMDIRSQPFDLVLFIDALCTLSVSCVCVGVTAEKSTNSPKRALTAATMLQRDTGMPTLPHAWKHKQA